MRIQNINAAYGDDSPFDGQTLEEAVAALQAAIRACGPEFANVVVTEKDYALIAIPCPNCDCDVRPEPDQRGCGCHCPDCGTTL